MTFSFCQVIICSPSSVLPFFTKIKQRKTEGSQHRIKQSTEEEERRRKKKEEEGKTRQRMHSFLYRLNAVLTFSVLALGAICFSASMTDIIHTSNPTVDIKVKKNPISFFSSASEDFLIFFSHRSRLL